MKMKFPIIEIRENNLFVTMDFLGKFINGEVRIRHNYFNNKTKHVIDSDGVIWHLSFLRDNNKGIRKMVSLLFNISTDYYSYTVEENPTIQNYRAIITSYLISDDPDISELAESLIKPIDSCDPSDLLKNNIHLLNL